MKTEAVTIEGRLIGGTIQDRVRLATEPLDCTRLLAALGSGERFLTKTAGGAGTETEVEVAAARLLSGMVAVQVEVLAERSGATALKLPSSSTFVGIVRRGGFNAAFPDLGRKSFRKGDWFILRSGEVRLAWQGAVSLVLLAAEPEVLHRLVALAAPGECKALRCFTCPQLREPSLVQHAGGARLSWIAKRINLSKQNGLHCRLAIEAACLELLREVLSQPQLLTQQLCHSDCSMRDEESLREVAAYLDQRFEDDHTLGELSRRFSLNEFKLKRGFKSLFGMTVFTYIRQTRVRQAEELLMEGDRSVLEVATAVGYSNPSHFARNFRAHTGFLPKAYQRIYRGRCSGGGALPGTGG